MLSKRKTDKFIPNKYTIFFGHRDYNLNFQVT